MKPKLKIKATPRNKGEGHTARIAVILKAKIDIDGKVQNINIDYDLTITFEQIDYVVRQIAGGIAQAASKIARDGLTENRTESVTA